MSVEQSIRVFTIGYYTSIAIMILGIAFAVFIFFKCRIPTVYALMTGRIRKKTVEEMQKSGMLRSEEELEAEGFSGKSNDMLNNDSSIDYSTEALGQYQNFKVNPSYESSSPETTPFKDIPETTALKPAAETSLLKSTTETILLKSVADTIVLKESELFGIKNEIIYERAGKTERLDGGPKFTETTAETFEDPGTSLLKGKFVSIEHTVIIHTDQVI